MVEGMETRQKLESGVRELAEKTGAGYGKRELSLLLRMYPELEHQSSAEIQEIFFVEGKQLSVYEIGSLGMLFPQKSPQELGQFLSDEEQLKQHIDSIALASKSEKQKFWQIFTVLPLSEQIERYIFQKLGDTNDDKLLTETLKEAKTEDEVSAQTSTRVNLPLGSLPHLETYIASSVDKEHFDIPKASIFIINKASGGVERISLTSQETAAALAYARNRIAYIDTHRIELAKRYQEINGLGEDVGIKIDDLKEFYFQKFTERRLREVVEEKFAKDGRVFDDDTAGFEIRFSQYKKGLSEHLKSVVNSSELLNKHFVAKLGAETPRMIPLTAFAHFIKDNEVFLWDNLPQSVALSSRRYVSNKAPSRENQFNELQQAHLEIAHATQTGDWSKAIDIYNKYLDYWPQYIEHRLGALDIGEKFRTGEIKEYPKRILSIASGPHEELRAFYDISQKLSRPLPEVVSLDVTLEMLQKSRATLPDQIKKTGQDIVGDMRALPVGDKTFDMIECSSFDNLKDEADIKDMLVRAVNVLKIGGVMRFMTAEPFSDELCAIFEKKGINILEKNKMPRLTEEIRDRILKERGEEVLRRIEYKMKRHVYFLARVDSTVNAEEFKKECSAIPVFTPRRRLNATRLKDALEEQVERGMEAETFDANINLAVSLNPVFLLERKNLREEYLRYALEHIKGQVDFANAVRLCKTYFSDARLSKYCDIVFEIVSEFPQAAKRFFSLNLLGHENKRVQTLFQEYLNKNFSIYLVPLLESSFEEKIKVEILRAANYTNEALERLSRYLAQASQDDVKLASLAYIFNGLPEGTRLDLPLEMRFSSMLRDYYFKFSKEVPTRGEYTEGETRAFFFHPQKGIIPDERLISSAFLMAQQGDARFGNEFFSYIRSQEPSWITAFSTVHQVELQNLISTLKAAAQGGNLLRLREFEKNYLGISIEEETYPILKGIIAERYRHVFDAYFIPRKNIEKAREDFLRDVDALCKSSAEEFNISVLEAQRLLIQSIEKLPYGKTPRLKNERMTRIAREHITKELSVSLGKLHELDSEAQIRIIRWVWKNQQKSLADIRAIEGLLMTKPEIVSHPSFLQEIRSAFDTIKGKEDEWDWHSFVNPYLEVAIRYHERIPDNIIPAKSLRLMRLLGDSYDAHKLSAENVNKLIETDPELIGNHKVFELIKEKRFDLLLSRFGALQEGGRKQVVCEVVKRLRLGPGHYFQPEYLEFLNTHRLNAFSVKSIDKRYDFNLSFSGFLVFATVENTDSGMIEIFVPRSLANFRWNHTRYADLRLSLVPSITDRNRLVGKIEMKV